MFQKLLGLIKIKALMIKVNVITGDNNWNHFIKNPINYINRKIQKLNKLDKSFHKKDIYWTLFLAGNKEIKNLNNKFRKKINQQTYYPFRFKLKKSYLLY